MRLSALMRRRRIGGGEGRRRRSVDVAVEPSSSCWATRTTPGIKQCVTVRGSILALLVAVLTIQQRLILLHHYALSSVSSSVSPLPLPPSTPSSRNLDGVVGRLDRTQGNATTESTRPVTHLDPGQGNGAVTPPATASSAGTGAHERRMDAPIVSVRHGEEKPDDGDGDAGWLNFLDVDVYLDGFSDSWYMSIDTFVNTKDDRLQEIEAVEQACFNLFEDREDQVRMPMDWLQWSVEHMSNWWKVLDVPSDRYAHSRVLHYLDKYVDERRVGRPTPISELQPTLAMVAFQRYSGRARATGISNRDNEMELRQRYEQLTVSSLSATLASLMRTGMGRIVVVGWNASESVERPLVDEAFRRFASPNATANPTQLAYVTVPTDLVRTNFIPVNVPRGALLGLRHALTGNDPEWTEQWLGTSKQSSPWEFVYLTEPDTILHARPSAFRDMERMLRRGRILVPHRLQPIPYQGDVPESDRRHTYISTEQVVRSTKIVELDAASSRVACCDEQRGITHLPGPQAAAQAGWGTECGWDKWWQCGFLANSSHHGNHSLILNHYRLIRLAQGTGVTLVAGSSHGRRCVPTILAAGNGTTSTICPRRSTLPKDGPKLHVRPKNPWITPQRLQERRAQARRDQRTSSNQTSSAAAR